MRLPGNKWMLIILFLFPILAKSNQLPVFQLDSVKIYKKLAEKYASYWVDESGSIDIEELLSREKQLTFQAVGTGLPNLKKVFWCKWQIQNKLLDPNAVKNWTLDIGKGDYIEVYFVNPAGQIIEHQTIGELMPMSKKSLYQKHFVERIPFSLIANQTITMYIRLHRISGFPPQLQMELYQRDFYERENYHHQVPLRWMFFGMLFTFFFFGMGVFLATKDHTFLYYALFILGLGGYLVDAFFNVFGNILFFREYPMAIMYLVYALVTLMNVCHIMFIRSYINSSVNFPTWDRMASYIVFINLALLGVAWGIYYFTTDEFFTDKIIIPVIILSYFFLISIVFPILRMKKGSIENYIILTSTSLFTISIFVNAISIFNGTNLRILETQLILLAVILVFSLGLAISLAYRFHRHQKEKLKLTRLQDLNVMKAQFYQNITHEFRTPLTVIKGMAQEIQEEILEKQQHKLSPKLEMIQRSGNNLLDLIDKLLSMAKLEKNQAQLNLQHGNLIIYLRYLLDSLVPFAKTKNVELQFVSQESNIWMDYDEEKIRQIFYNILFNAIKFSKQNGLVSVTIEVLDKDSTPKLLLSIKDNGIGIAQKDLALVFERFYQVPKTLSSSSQGSGIGLALTKELLELMDGKIILQSELHKGTTVKISIPIQQKLSVQASQVLGNEHHFIEEGSSKKQHNLSNPKLNNLPIAPSRPQVLLIEDNQDVRTYLISILEKEYELFIAEDGQKGIDIALDKIPDLIISDVVMPNKNGYDVCRILKNAAQTSHIPILLLTAKTTKEDRIEGFTQGADAYIVKPFEKKELKLILQNMLAHRQKIQKRLVEVPPQQYAAVEDVSAKDRQFLKRITNYIQDNISNENLDVAL
ncbi:MAG: ATP-binding protein, partial [Saprospiraceae bacterium]